MLSPVGTGKSLALCWDTVPMAWQEEGVFCPKPGGTTSRWKLRKVPCSPDALGRCFLGFDDAEKFSFPFLHHFGDLRSAQDLNGKFLKA